MDVEKWLEKIRERIELNIKPNNTFHLKDLFAGFEWEELSKGDRISLGRCFSSAVNDGKFPNIVKVEKSKGSLTCYKKIK